MQPRLGLFGTENILCVVFASFNVLEQLNVYDLSHLPSTGVSRNEVLGYYVTCVYRSIASHFGQHAPVFESFVQTENSALTGACTLHM